MRLSLHPSTCLPICLSVCLSLWSVVSQEVIGEDKLCAVLRDCDPCVCLPVYLAIYLPVCLPVYLSVCLSLWSVMCQGVIGEDKLRVILHVRDPCVCLSIHPCVYPSIYLSICLPVCPSIYLYIYPCLYLLLLSVLSGGDRWGQAACNPPWTWPACLLGHCHDGQATRCLLCAYVQDRWLPQGRMWGLSVCMSRCLSVYVCRLSTRHVSEFKSESNVVGISRF